MMSRCVALLFLLAQDRDPLDRLVADAKGPPCLRRDVAIDALKAYGPAALERLEKAQADPKVIEACRSLTLEMQVLRQKLETKKIDLNFENTRPEDILLFIRDFAGVNLILDGRFKLDPNRTITVKENDQTVWIALKRVLGKIDRELRVELVDGPVLLITRQPPAAPALAPVRMAIDPANLPALVEALGSDDVETRDRATASLRKLGFAAEPALWSALDSPSAEARARSAEMLRTLYAPPPPPGPGSIEAKLRQARVTVDMQNAPLTAILDYLREITSLNFCIDPGSNLAPDREFMSFRAADLSLEAILRLLLVPLDLQSVVVDGQILIARRGRILRSPPGPYWASPEEARRIGAFLADLGSGEDARQKAAVRELVGVGEAALGPLLEASRTFDARTAQICFEARRQIAGEKKAWLADDPSGADLQVLTESQRKQVGTLLSVRLEDQVLRPVLEAFSIKVDFRAEPDLKVTFAANDVPVGSALRVLLRPRGLDFYLEGGAIVIDTAANVRSKIK